MPLDLLKQDPLIATNFFMEIDGEVITTLSEVSGLDLEVEVAEVIQRTASGQLVHHKTLSKPKWTGELTVKRTAPLDVTPTRCGSGPRHPRKRHVGGQPRR